jgi:hypothetical protein
LKSKESGKNYSYVHNSIFGLSYGDNKFEENKPYYYVVRSYDIVSKKYSNYSNEVKMLITDVAEEENDSKSIISAYPNPFSESTSINYELQTAGRVRIDIFNSLGEKITTLVDEWQEVGRHSATFSVRANGCSPLQSGMYYYRIQIGQHTESGKLLLIK